MVSLEQVKLLETKVARAIDYVERVTGENVILQKKLDSYQKRIDELEVLVQRFKEDQGRIEDGILAALDRLNQFEDAIEKSLASRGSPPPQAEETIPGAGEAPPPEPEDAGENPEAEDEKDSRPAVDSGELDIF